MTAFLAWTVYAPLASWGLEAVGEVRGSQRHPTRSAVLGLVGAALGLYRDDREALIALEDGYGVALRVDGDGRALEDYHTAQSAPDTLVRRQVPQSRAELLSLGERKTILSRRSYRQESLTRVVAWARDDAKWSLDAIAGALAAPKFVPYAGRKSNPLGWPMHPSVQECQSLADAFESAFDAAPLGMLVPGTLRAGASVEVHHDPCVGFESGLETQRRSMPRDHVMSRTPWMFGTRLMETSQMTIGGGTP